MRTTINKKARETKGEVTGFMKTYLEDAEALDGLEFLSMAEAGEWRTGRFSPSSMRQPTTRMSLASSGLPCHFRRATSTPCESIRCVWRPRKIPPNLPSDATPAAGTRRSFSHGH